MSYSAGGIAGAEQNIYSFDGNAGGTGGIAELLVQSTSEEIELLPALPSSWRDGSAHGLRARGGFVVDVSWQDGRLATARITSPTEASVRVRHGDELLDLTIAAGATVEITAS
jgi:alpha-L-fucosidase 2